MSDWSFSLAIGSNSVTSVFTYRKLREQLGLYSTRKQAHTTESAGAALDAARVRFPTAGILELQNIIRMESEGMKVSRYSNSY